MVKIIKAIEGVCPQLGSCACVAAGNRYKTMVEDEKESEEISELRDKESEQIRSILYCDDRLFENIEMETILRDLNMSNKDTSYPWKILWLRVPSDEPLDINANKTRSHEKKPHASHKSKRSSKTKVADAGDEIPVLVVQNFDELEKLLPDKNWSLFDEIGSHFKQSEEFRDIAMNVFSKKDPQKDDSDLKITKTLEQQLEHTEDRWKTIGPELKKCIRNVDACSTVLDILKDDVKEMHEVHEKCLKIQHKGKKKDKDQIKKLKQQVDQLAKASTGMEKKLHFIEDAEANPAILEAYEKVNQILTDVDTELKRNKATVEQWSITTKKAAADIRNKMKPFKGQRDTLEENMNRLSEDHSKMMSLLGIGGNQSQMMKPKLTHRAMKVEISPQTAQHVKKDKCPYSQPVNLYNKERYNRWKPESHFTDADLRREIMAMNLKQTDVLGNEDKTNDLKLSVSKLSRLERGSSMMMQRSDREETESYRRAQADKLRDWYDSQFKPRRALLKENIEKAFDQIDSIVRHQHLKEEHQVSGAPFKKYT